MVSNLNDIQPSVDEVFLNSQKVNKWQIDLNFEFTDFDKIISFKENFSIIQKLWNGRKQF